MGQIAGIERGAHLIASYLEPVLRDLSISQGEAHVLVQLKDGPTPINQLHREFGHKRSTLTNILDRLESRKLVRRSANREDRRSLIVQLTAAGERIASHVADILDQLERQLSKSVGASELRAAEAVIHALDAIVRGSVATPLASKTLSSKTQESGARRR